MTLKRSLIAAALVLAAPTVVSQETREPASSSTTPAAATATAAPAPMPLPKPHEDMIKLWKANLSEDFIKRQIDTSNTVYNLTAEDIIQCRNAGMPESLIQAMLQTMKRVPGDVQAAETKALAKDAAKAGDSRAAMAPVPAPPPAPTPAPTPALAEKANMRWEGIVRRNSGIVILKSRWDPGVLEFREETLRWTDSRDSSKNLLIPAKQIKEQFLSCQKKPGGNECFEWGFRTKEGEFRFRDISWEQSENRKPQEIFEFMKAIYPNLVASNVPVESK
jgi:hypothetical protein